MKAFMNNIGPIIWPILNFALVNNSCLTLFTINLTSQIIRKTYTSKLNGKFMNMKIK